MTTSPHNTHWTPAEDKVLRVLWSVRDVASIASEIGRTPLSVERRAARVLRLPMGVPQGCESISAAAKRTGFHWSTLKTILRWAGVRVRPLLTSSCPSSRLAHKFVDSFDLDEAIVAWMTTETIADAARRYGVSGPAVERALVAAGVQVTTVRPGHGAIRRVVSAEVDRAMAERAARKTCGAKGRAS